jgi:hypothetical protein
MTCRPRIQAREEACVTVEGDLDAGMAEPLLYLLWVGTQIGQYRRGARAEVVKAQIGGQSRSVHRRGSVGDRSCGAADRLGPS